MQWSRPEGEVPDAVVAVLAGAGADRRSARKQARMEVKPEETAQPGPLVPLRGEIPSLVQALTRLGVLLVGGLYTVGLLIVNLDLGLYGLMSMELARPEYVMAGALWIFLVVVTIGAFKVVIGELKQILSTRLSAWRVFQALTEILIFAGFFAFVLFTLSRGELLYNKPPAWIVLGTICLNAYSLNRLVESSRAVLRFEKLSLKSLFSARVGGGTPIYYAVGLLSLIALYSGLAYPHFPRVFGGGKKPLIEFVLGEATKLAWKELGLPVSGDGKKIGPVILLLETDSMFIVATPGKPQLDVWSMFERQLPAVGIDKKEVSAIVYREKAK